MAKFKKEILDAINSDADLFAAVSKACGVKPSALPQTLKRNGTKLNQYSIVTLVASHLGMKPEDVVEEEKVDNQVEEEQK